MIKTQRGLALVNVLMSLVIFSIVMVSLMQITVNQKQMSAQVNRSDQASDTVVRSISNLYYSDFYDLVSYCSEKGALNGTYQGGCVKSGKLSSEASSSEKDQALFLEQPTDDRGMPSTSPTMCTEIYSCKILAGGQLLEVFVNQFYVANNNVGTVYNKLRSFRKSRW